MCHKIQYDRKSKQGPQANKLGDIHAKGIVNKRSRELLPFPSFSFYTPPEKCAGHSQHP
jgi:hypothetical protein